MADGPSEAWLDAAADLDLHITAPFTLADALGRTYECIALVRDFGSEQGTVVIGSGQADARVAGVATEAGFFCSAVNESAYATYDRSLFQETLNDWGWCSDAARRPVWYSGEPWTP